MNATSARLAALLLLLVTPLASGWLAGFPEGFAELPRRTVTIDPPAYAPAVYAFFALGLLAAAGFLAAPRVFGLGGGGRSDFTSFDWASMPRRGNRFPRHGWIGLALIAVSWPAAWLHPDWLGVLADHTFFPLWLGYILTVDAFAFRRAGTSPLARSTAGWLAWFPASAAAWWYFELLNRFIQNWVYLGVENFSALRYIAGSTLAFSTVIPAVLTTAALLSTFDCFHHRFVRGTPRHSAGESRATIWRWSVAAGVLGLALMPWFPVHLFALIWLAPLLIIAGLLEISGRDTSLGHLLRGDWGPVVTLAVAALICGFFWELWNIHAMPKWTYQIPWVNRFELFEMPLVGYLGYLPFGPACWAFWLLVSPDPKGVCSRRRTPVNRGGAGDHRPQPPAAARR